jgi:hypothetical protein
VRVGAAPGMRAGRLGFGPGGAGLGCGRGEVGPLAAPGRVRRAWWRDVTGR